jgi:transcriptional regulator with XRE-family HTH domain
MEKNIFTDMRLSGMDLKILRLKAKLKQYEVGMRAGIPPNRLSEIEADRRQPSPELLERILEVIGGNSNSHERERK